MGKSHGIMGLLLGGMGGLLAGVLLGLLIAEAVGYWQTGGVNVPYAADHNDIANRFTVYSVTWKKNFVLTHLRTTVFTLQHNVLPLETFKVGESYTQSNWGWCENGDVEVWMSVTGPLSDGNYLVDFARSGYNAVEIKGFSLSVTWAVGDYSQSYAYVFVKTS